MGGPPYPNVNFDFGRAQAVIAAIDDLTTVLTQQRKDRMSNGQALFTSWTGRYANEFSTDLTTMSNDIDTLLATLSALRAKISNGVDSAHREQQRRDRANQDFSSHQQHRVR
jgi:hypothetical protein